MSSNKPEFSNYVDSLETFIENFEDKFEEDEKYNELFNWVFRWCTTRKNKIFK